MSSMVIGPVRLSYLSVLEKSESPSGDMQYSAVAMIPKKDKALLAKVHLCIKKAADEGVKKGKIKKMHLKNLYLPLRDGDDKDDRGAKGAEFDGMFWMNVKNKSVQPSVVDLSREPILDDEEIYSGMWGHIHVNFSAYNFKGNVGVGVYLNHIMKTKDDERLDGRVAVDEAFSDIEPDAEGDLE